MMKAMTVLEKYPVLTIEIEKNKTTYANIDEIFAYLREKINTHPIATYIGEFDHYAHTSALPEGSVADEIKAAKNLLCCFGKVLPKPEVLAVRPRSIGIADMGEYFAVSFMEAPNPDANKAMESWVKGIENL
jgi:hypothetical protein